MDKPVDGAEALARTFHETYERLAPSFGYETRPDTKAFDPTTPNGQLMTAVCGEVFAALVAENERLSVIADQTQFLCDRLDELDWSQNLIGITRDFCGHVDPPLHRLKTALETRNG